MDPTRDADLDAIPTETTLDERRFLRELFRDHWSGAGSVCEIGPFLGGSTRAIALGMADNPRRSTRARLHTHDKFAAYHEPAKLVELLRPAIDAGTVRPQSVATILATGSFKTAFDDLHADTRYGGLVTPWLWTLPDTPEAVPAPCPSLANDPDLWFEAVFVDGCKSWFATRHALAEVLPRAAVGSFVIFQDFLCYTCFWIPAFVETFADHLSLAAYVDMTYAFRLTRPLSRATIEERFAEAPERLGPAHFDALFKRLLSAATARNDENALVCHAIHYAGALAYLGHRDDARNLLHALRDDAAPPRLLPLVGLALHSPTYVPDGRGGLSEILL